MRGCVSGNEKGAEKLLFRRCLRFGTFFAILQGIVPWKSKRLVLQYFMFSSTAMFLLMDSFLREFFFSTATACKPPSHHRCLNPR